MKNYLHQALKQYNLQNETATLTGHNENMAFNVADLFLLRIHKAAENFNSDFLYQDTDQTAVVAAEMEYLRYLKNCGLNVQSPVLNIKGDSVSVLNDRTPATLLSWIKGRCLCENDLTEDLCNKLGKAVAQLHNISKNYKNENLLKYDNSVCNAIISRLKTAYRKKYFTEKHYNILSLCCNTVKKVFSESKNSFTVIHGDLSLSNTLLTDDGLVLIDFSLCGYGHPMMDISCVYSFMPDDVLKSAFISGYTACGNTIDSDIINVCYAFNELMGIMLHIDKLSTETWFESWLEKLCKNIFIPVIEKREILWTELNV